MKSAACNIVVSMSRSHLVYKEPHGIIWTERGAAELQIQGALPRFPSWGDFHGPRWFSPPPGGSGAFSIRRGLVSREALAPFWTFQVSVLRVPVRCGTPFLPPAPRPARKAAGDQKERGPGASWYSFSSDSSGTFFGLLE